MKIPNAKEYRGFGKPPTPKTQNSINFLPGEMGIGMELAVEPNGQATVIVHTNKDRRLPLATFPNAEQGAIFLKAFLKKIGSRPATPDDEAGFIRRLTKDGIQIGIPEHL